MPNKLVKNSVGFSMKVSKEKEKKCGRDCCSCDRIRRADDRHRRSEAGGGRGGDIDDTDLDDVNEINNGGVVDNGGGGDNGGGRGGGRRGRGFAGGDDDNRRPGKNNNYPVRTHVENHVVHNNTSCCFGWLSAKADFNKKDEDDDGDFYGAR
jgi:hypothetical protein